MRYYLCHYVRREDPGDLLLGFHWREAIWAYDGQPKPKRVESYSFYEKNMFDKETGKNVGDTRNFCISPKCKHEDCGPTILIFDSLKRS